MGKQIIEVAVYRSNEFFDRNQKIWSARYHKEWSLQQIAKHFQLPINEVKDILATHKQFYKQEYG